MAVNWKTIGIISLIFNLLLIGLAIYLFLNVKSRDTPPIPEGCTSNSACPYGQSCINGKCQEYTPPVQCSTKRDCPKDYSCKNKKCVLSGLQSQ